ncbi:uncharacterized protein LOC129913028 [Episyrphus balteatus]|uniref:uncharacterized protein LOC129913028 n=1 Tax=Episyrphus balteatus TaxID=286459 RepID=UPI00248505AB|nr:uncharacterized protein LOC129913028 [Episyrphus balteatus]
MFSSPALLSFLILAIVATTTFAYPKESKNQLIKVISKNDISKLTSLPKGLELIPLSQKNHETRGLVQYSLGEVTSSSRLIATGSDEYSWDTEKNIQLVFEIPSSGVPIGAIIILADTSSDEGQAYVTSGGLGEETATIVLEVLNTSWLNYNIEVYSG